MSDTQNPIDSISHLESILAELKLLRREHAFLERVMIQAVLSYGGRLVIDTSKAEDAMSGNHRLEYGSNSVTIHGSPQSLWPKHNTQDDTKHEH